MSSRFVVSTLNGMFIAQLAAWMAAPPAATLIGTTPSTTSHPALLSRANDDPAPPLDDEWLVVIPDSLKQPDTLMASELRPTSRQSEAE